MNKEKYRKLCAEEKTIPIYSKDWWLDTVCGDENWDVCVVEKGNQIIATNPYIIKKRFNLTLLSHPPLTQKLGPWLRDSYFSNNKKLSNEKEILTEIEKQFPRFDYFSQNWHYEYSNWLPFYWLGYSQTTRYTYQLKELSNLDKVWSNIENSTRRQITKARDKLGLILEKNASVDDFIKLNEQTFNRQKLELPYSADLIRKIYNVCKQYNSCEIFIAKDSSGQHHAGIFIIHDELTTYYIMGGASPELRNSGAMSLCMWEAITAASIRGNIFDFEGSMIEPIEQFFRKFGASQVPYLNVNKANSFFIKLFMSLKK